MSKKLLLLCTCLFVTVIINAQSKVFKEVGEDIATQVRAITQDKALVGYLSFTRLEKVDEKTSSYKITIMDENLNDIGTVKFNESMLDLQTVSFEQDVLCLSYMKTTPVEVPNKNPRKKPTTDYVDSIFNQFISLDGKIINTYSTKVSKTRFTYYAGMNRYYYYYALKHGLQVKNLTKRGFVMYYGDETDNMFTVFDTKGNVLWKRELLMAGDGFVMHTSGGNIYMLTKTNSIGAPEGGYRLYTYQTSDTTAETKYDLKDKKGNWLKIVSIDNDPVTGKPYVAGCIINPEHQNNFTRAKDYNEGLYLGLATVNFNGANNITANYSYWGNNEIPALQDNGMFKDNHIYVRYASAFKDYDGNTIFTGAALLEEKLLAFYKYKLTDAAFVKQDAKAGLTLDNTLACDDSKAFGPPGTVSEYDKKGFYRVTNNETKTNYIIVDDDDNTYIYNVNTKKLLRTVPHKEGRIKTSVFPAKEGHVMISEYNKKEKYTRVSIEAL